MDYRASNAEFLKRPIVEPAPPREREATAPFVWVCALIGLIVFGVIFAPGLMPFALLAIFFFSLL
jgi:hypothetical protein